MPTIRKEIEIEASPAQVWDAVSGISDVYDRLVPRYAENTLIHSHERTLKLPNGGMARECIVSIDAEARGGRR